MEYKISEIIEIINDFSNLDEKELEKLDIDDSHWIPEDYWSGFGDALTGLKRYLYKKRDQQKEE